jgi:hypothetical protein
MERIPAPSGSVCAMATFSFPVWHRSVLADNYCSFDNTVIRLNSRTLPQNTAENDDFANILTRHNEPNPVRNEQMAANQLMSSVESETDLQQDRI